MRFLNVRRLVVAGSVVAAAVSLPVVAAGVANASPQRCEISLHNDGYIVGPKVKAACKNANADRNSLNVVANAQRLACKAQLVSVLKVKSSHAQAACYSY